MGVDESGVTFVVQEFELHLVLQKVVTCQKNYKGSVNKQAGKVSKTYREEFKRICTKKCMVVTVVDIYVLKTQIDKMALLFPQTSYWVD